MKKRFLGIALGAMMGLTVLTGCTPKSAFLGNNAAQSESTFVTLTSATNGKTLNLLSDDVLEFVTNYQINVSSPLCSKYVNGTTIAKPTPARLEWEDTRSADCYTVNVSLKADMSDALTYTTFQKFVDVEDLFMGKTYYYQVYAHRGDRITKSKVFTFNTAHQPRLFNFTTSKLDSNARDIGGYYTEDGKYRVKQGMAIRGAEIINYAQEEKDKLLYEHGIKTELSVHAKETPDLEGVPNYVHTKGPHYVEWSGIAFYGEQNKDDLKNELLVFADANNFPVFFHCQLGRDRTGTLAFLLSALLGVSKKDIFMDYELSYLTQYGGYGWMGENNPETKVYQFEAMYQYIQEGTCLNYSSETLRNPYCNPSATLAENTASYLKGMLGITDAQIAAIRTNLLEEV